MPRVIGGTHRGRRLASPPPGVRPTSDRVRESIFARLGDVAGLRVLDLFAGTGALGIEALSRGAEAVVFVDRARRAALALEQNLEALGLSGRVVRADARGALRRLGEAGEAFDLVFVDPPYDAGEYARVLPLLAELGLLARHAMVVVEGAKRHSLAPVAGLVIDSERVYGDTVVRWLVEDPGDEMHPTGSGS